MPRLTKIYTKKGDQGQTSLGGGQRVPKDHLRVTAYGTVDELNSQIGVALAVGVCEQLATVLSEVQNELFDLGSDLAFVEEDKTVYKLPQIEARHIERLEDLIDEITATVGPLENFILPGGSLGSAQLHMARTICRRAERDVATLMREETVSPHVLAYLNRLSDALFVMARYENFVQGEAEPLWRPGA
ncbi:MAG: cob(I)yrinic acid a,c-diamide adenosyltransferase [Caldilineaceae bacterium]|jgi:cob(I)alamin adenosyltransferase|nr:cob(I)yrinic acid a,c-diamide adenosyltransferase [Caldilineaceae bacterium]